MWLKGALFSLCGAMLTLALSRVKIDLTKACYS
jgi:hypothetical protein